MGEVRLTRNADDDLLQLFLYGFDAFGLTKAQEYRDGVVQCFELLADYPRIGRLADETGLDMRRHEHAHHVIFYMEIPEGVLITAIIHQRQLPR